MNSETVYQHNIPHSPLTFYWYVSKAYRIPVLVDTNGVARKIACDADQLRLCDVLDAIMRARRAKLWPSNGIREEHSTRSEGSVIVGDASWGPCDWAVIAFSGCDIDIGHCQESINRTRKNTDARTRLGTALKTEENR